MTEEFLIGLGGLFGLLALIIIRVPIAYSMILVALVGIMLQSGPTIILNQLKDLAYGQFSNYDLSVLPMFILMGGLAARCGLSSDIFRGANAWLGRFQGGVAMAASGAMKRAASAPFRSIVEAHQRHPHDGSVTAPLLPVRHRDQVPACGLIFLSHHSLLQLPSPGLEPRTASAVRTEA